MRLKFLARVYEVTRDPMTLGVAMDSIGQELGFSFEITKQVADYLKHEGLIEYPMLGLAVKITHDGIVEVEKVLSDPPIPTEHFPASVISQYKTARFFDVVENKRKDDIEVILANNHPDNADFDVFISHASEDKDSFVRPFAEKLRSMGLRVWYDEFELRWGSKLMKSINHGLKNSKYGIVVLSSAFFGKGWPEAELASLFSLMITSGKDTLLPLRHGISHKELAEKAPLLSDIVNRSSDIGMDALAQEFYRIVKGQQSGLKEQPDHSELSKKKFKDVEVAKLAASLTKVNSARNDAAVRSAWAELEKLGRDAKIWDHEDLWLTLDKFLLPQATNEQFVRAINALWMMLFSTREDPDESQKIRNIIQNRYMQILMELVNSTDSDMSGLRGDAIRILESTLGQEEMFRVLWRVWNEVALPIENEEEYGKFVTGMIPCMERASNEIRASVRQELFESINSENTRLSNRAFNMEDILHLR